MLEGKRIYISDVHMGPKKDPQSDYDYNWLGPAEAKVFAEFLAYLNADEEVKEIILLGDTMDNWVRPVYAEPPIFKDIVDAPHNRAIIRTLRALCGDGKKKVIYMPGNHDMTITREFVVGHFPGIIFGGSALNNSVYRTSRLLAEHGSAHAMFNAPDPINDPGRRLPLGYYISRVAATKEARTGSAQRHFWTYFDDFLEMLGPQKLPESVFEAILEEADLPQDVEIVMPPVGGKPTSISASEVKQRYANLYEQWEAHYGRGIAFKAMMAEIGYLGDLADTLTKKGDTNVVIFGHSHESELDKDSWFVEDRIYANCGSWCDEKEPCAFVETQKDNAQRIHYVRLKTWDKKQKRPHEEFEEECVEL